MPRLRLATMFSLQQIIQAVQAHKQSFMGRVASRREVLSQCLQDFRHYLTQRAEDLMGLHLG